MAQGSQSQAKVGLQNRESASPQVSVVLPAYNAAATIAAAVRSVLRQTFSDFELLVIDDGSTDGTPEILQKFRDSRLRILHQAHAGLVAALNRGIEAARAPWIARMDADDICHRRRLEKQLAFAQNHPELGAVGCLVHMFPARNLRPGMRAYVAWLNSLCTAEEIARHAFVEMPVPHPTLMIRRAILLQAGGYREGDFPEDYELFLRLHTMHVNIAKIQEVLYFWRDHEKRLSRTASAYRREAFAALKTEYAARMLLRDRPFRIWGAGKTGRRLARLLLQQGCPPQAFVDVDPHKIGRSWRGIPIESFTRIRRGEALYLICVGRPGARRLIQNFLSGVGWREGVDFLCFT